MKSKTIRSIVAAAALLLSAALVAPSAMAQDAGGTGASASSVPSQAYAFDHGRATIHARQNGEATPKAVSNARFELVLLKGVAPGSEQAASLVRDPGSVSSELLSQSRVITLEPTDADGDVALEWLELGVYLLREARSSNASAIGYAPLVFSLPSKDSTNDAVLAFNLSIYPKVPGVEPTPSPTATPSSSPSATPTASHTATPIATPTEPKGTQTGDEIRERTTWMLFFGGGLLLIACMLLLGGRRRRGERS